MKKYIATDRRCYNGCGCSDLEKERNNTKYLEERMKKAESLSGCTYFPMEGKYLVFTNCSKDPKVMMELVGPPQVLTGNFHENKQDALIEAITILEVGKGYQR